jgi:transposase
MASLQRVRSGGRSYWRIVESRRVNGKPRPVPILHLGTADALLDRLLKVPSGQLRVRTFQHGDVAALKSAADQLDVIRIIDQHVPKHTRRLSVGTTLLLAAINRAVRPRSKRGWAAWAENISLVRLFPGLAPQQHTSQYFWDQMHCVPLKALEAIEDELTRKVVKDLGIELDLVFYDTTNFFTVIASTNKKPELPQRGKSKQHREDLRLFSLALLVSRAEQIPLCSHVYEGNTVDGTVFPTTLTKMRERLERLSLSLKDVTIVYDKGNNNSQRNQALVDSAPFSYVASLIPTHFPELMEIPVSTYHPIEAGPLAGTLVLRLSRKIWEVERTVLLSVSDQLRTAQIRGLDQHLQKRLRALNQWQEQLAKPRSGPKSRQAVDKKIAAFLRGQHLKKILRIEFDEKKSGAGRLTYWVDADARAKLETEVFGKRILITDRDSWSDAEVILAYHGQSHVEDAFRQLKDDEHLAVRPQRHWTDQKIHVHTFTCLLALLLARVVENAARKAQWQGGLSGLLDQLGKIRLAMILRPSSEQGGRPKCEWQLEETPPDRLRLFEQLVPNRPPFVYTSPRA